MPVDNDDDNYIEPTESSMSLPTKCELQSFQLIATALLGTTVEEIKQGQINVCF